MHSFGRTSFLNTHVYTAKRCVCFSITDLSSWVKAEQGVVFCLRYLDSNSVERNIHQFMMMELGRSVRLGDRSRGEPEEGSDLELPPC